MALCSGIRLMTSNTLKENVGKTMRWVATRKLIVDVKVKDARETFGRTDLLISPVSGEGEQWVSLESCKPKETKI